MNTSATGNHALQSLAQRLGYRFHQPALLEQALRHRSFVHENPGEPDNERLEFLGDAVLSLIIAQHLLERYPQMSEGQLSRLRSQLVSASRLARAAQQLGLGSELKLGRGEMLTGGAQKESVLADAFEAVLAAIYCDGGLEAARALVMQHIAQPAQEAAQGMHPVVDPRSRLQELLQGKGRQSPEYCLVAESGPDHDKTFQVQVSSGAFSATGSGKTKKRAAEQAARVLLEQLLGPRQEP